MWPAARAAGLSPTQIAAAFHNDTNLRTDFSKVRTTHDAMVGCVVKGGTCGNEISAYASAQQGLTTEKMGVWQKLFQSPNANTKQAAAFLSQMQNLRERRHELFAQALGSSAESAQPRQ